MTDYEISVKEIEDILSKGLEPQDAILAIVAVEARCSDSMNTAQFFKRINYASTIKIKLMRQRDAAKSENAF